MLNDLPKPMRKDLDSQLGLIWLLISDPKCFPSIAFTPKQQQAICDALEKCSPPDKEFKYTYEALVQHASDLKFRNEADGTEAKAEAEVEAEGSDAAAAAADVSSS